MVWHVGRFLQLEIDEKRLNNVHLRIVVDIVFQAVL